MKYEYKALLYCEQLNKKFWIFTVLLFCDYKVNILTNMLISNIFSHWVFGDASENRNAKRTTPNWINNKVSIISTAFTIRIEIKDNFLKVFRQYCSNAIMMLLRSADNSITFETLFSGKFTVLSGRARLMEKMPKIRFAEWE